MQIENDYDKEVYNGDIGTIDDVDADVGELTVIFDYVGAGLRGDHSQKPVRNTPP